MTIRSVIITEHRMNFNHNFKWDNVEIIDIKRFWDKRLISKMLYIKKQTKALNLTLSFYIIFTY